MQAKYWVCALAEVRRIAQLLRSAKKTWEIWLAFSSSSTCAGMPFSLILSVCCFLGIVGIKVHLSNASFHLDRMPKPIGAFISKHVYGGQLNSVHTVTSRRSCILVDVSRGEETKSGNSWTVSTMLSCGSKTKGTDVQRLEHRRSRYRHRRCEEVR